MVCGVRKILIDEVVPKDYRHIYLCYGRKGLIGVLAIEGEPVVLMGETKLLERGTREEADYMDWLGMTMMRIREELGGMR